MQVYLGGQSGPVESKSRPYQVAMDQRSSANGTLAYTLILNIAIAYLGQIYSRNARMVEISLFVSKVQYPNSGFFSHVIYLESVGAKFVKFSC